MQRTVHHHGRTAISTTQVLTMSTPPVLNITIPVFNRCEITRQTILAVRKNTRVAHKLVVVDNGSEEPTRIMLLRLRDAGIIDHLFRLEQNLGVAVASNIGWRMVSCPIYMKLDNDVIIDSPKWFDLLMLHIKTTEGRAVFGADLHKQLDSPTHVPKREGFVGLCQTHVSGGAILIPRSISDVAGYWCEDYGLYGCEDGDYGLRMRYLGFDQYYFDHAPLMRHIGHDTEEMKSKYNINKQELQTSYRSLWNTNYYLYHNKYRAPNIPPQVKVCAYDGYTIHMENNIAYSPMFKAFLELHNAMPLKDTQEAKFVDTLNRFISVQNATWEAATQDAEHAYTAHRVHTS